MNDLWGASIDRRTAAVLASLSDAIVVTDPAGTILRLNPVAERLIGRGSDELAGSEPPYDYWPAEDVERLLELVRLADCEEEGAPPPWIDTAYAHVSGRRLPVRVTVCCHMRYSLHIASPRLELDEEPAPNNPIRERLGALESGLRNIAWELQALGVHAPVTWVRPGAMPPAALRELTPRQREVLDAFIQGYSVAATAMQLHVSEHTVRSHLKVIYRKMGVRSKTELMRRIAHAAGG